MAWVTGVGDEWEEKGLGSARGKEEAWLGGQCRGWEKAGCEIRTCTETQQTIHPE